MRIGLDLGGTKIAGAVLDDTAQIRAHMRVPTPKDYDAILKTCADMALALEAQAGVPCTLGICMPGAIDSKAGIVRFAPNTQSMAGKNIVADMKTKYGRDIRIANDAACFALSEVKDGAVKNKQNVYGIILGTGVGGCQIVEGRIPHGANALHEWGHVPLPWAEETDIPTRCGCGRLGCIESYLSGPALHRQLKAKLGRDIDNDELVAGINQNNPDIMDVMDGYCTRLAKALAMLVLILDPDAFVLGGGVSNLDIIYQSVPKRLGHYCGIENIQTPVLKAMHGDDSGMRGAAWLY